MSKAWYSLRLGDGMTSGALVSEIESAFARSFGSANPPAEMAVFTRAESEGRLHCEVIAYFSPAAQELAEAFDAEPCDPPRRSGLGLLAGEEAAWSILFPEG